MSSSSIPVNHCNSHDSHLFAEPLCKDLTLLRRIANVAFHVLTLGVPLAIYHLTSLCCSRRFAVRKIDDLAASEGVSEDIKPYSPLGLAALEFAKAKLAEHSEVQPWQFSAGSHSKANTNQPTNLEIAFLENLYWDVAYENFTNLLKDTENPWENVEVITAADECMKIAFAISNLTLDDLKPFTENLQSSKDETRTFAKALTEQDSYQYRTFFECTVIYHIIRGELIWDKEKENVPLPQSISKAHANSFYKQGTVQRSWNQLYNEYCDRVRLYVKEKDLEEADARHVNWTKKDTGIKEFTRLPDTMPT